MAKGKKKGNSDSLVRGNPVIQGKDTSRFWSGVLQNLIATVIGGLLVAGVGAYFAKPWIEAKIGNLTNTTIQGNGNELNQSIMDLNQTIRTQGDKNQTAALQGDNNVNNQSISEIKTDFKQDSSQSDIVIEQIKKGLVIHAALGNPGIQDGEVKKLESDLDKWIEETTFVLSKVSRKASVYFQNVDQSGPSYSYSGNQRAGEVQAIIRKCLNALNDILKTS